MKSILQDPVCYLQKRVHLLHQVLKTLLQSVVAFEFLAKLAMTELGSVFVAWSLVELEQGLRYSGLLEVDFEVYFEVDLD